MQADLTPRRPWNSNFRADYHQQYLARNPDGYFPNHSCGIPYRSALLYSGAKA
jgi:peptide methionine sulfoxide reductase MsrA